jgi:uncharacterized protein
LGIACVANESGHVNRVMEQALNLVKSIPSVEIVRTHLELL